jgi:hypothetical protein
MLQVDNNGAINASKTCPLSAMRRVVKVVESQSNTEIRIAMSSTSRLNFETGIGSTLDDCCDLLGCFGVGDGSRLDRDAEIVDFDIFGLVEGVFWKGIKFFVTSQSSLDGFD